MSTFKSIFDAFNRSASHGCSTLTWLLLVLYLFPCLRKLHQHPFFKKAPANDLMTVDETNEEDSFRLSALFKHFLPFSNVDIKIM